MASTCATAAPKMEGIGIRVDCVDCNTKDHDKLECRCSNEPSFVSKTLLYYLLVIADELGVSGGGVFV